MYTSHRTLRMFVLHIEISSFEFYIFCKGLPKQGSVAIENLKESLIIRILFIERYLSQ